MEKDVQPKQTPTEMFIKEYEALCEKHGLRIQVVPAWVGTNHGSFEMTLQYSVAQLPKKE